MIRFKPAECEVVFRLALIVLISLGVGESRCDEQKVKRQPVSKWVTELKAPLKNTYRETNERGQELELGEREISFKLTQPADSVVVEVLFMGYAGSGGEVYMTFEVTPDDPYPSSSNRVSCGYVAIWRRSFGAVAADSVLRVAWDYVWDEELAGQRAVAGWGVEAYGGGVTKQDLPRRLGTVHRTSYRYPPTCDEWLPDPYRPQEIWGTWRHDERGRVVQGGYVIQTIVYTAGESESRVHMQPSLAALATENGVGEEEVVRRVLLEGQDEFWGWYSIPGPGTGTLLSEMRSLRKRIGVDSLMKEHPWLDRNWDWRKEP